MKPGDRLFRLLEIATVGYPFCAFKLLMGAVLAGLPPWRVAGTLLVALGTVDIVLNVAAFVAGALGRGSRLPVCTAQWLLSRARPGRESWRQLGLSADAMLSFGVVAAMIGFGLLRDLPPAGRAAWNTCVVFNVLGAGLGRLAESVLALGTDRPAR